MSRLRKAGLLAAGGATVAAIGVGTGGKKQKLQQQAQIKVIKNLEHLKQRQPLKLLVRKKGRYVCSRFRPFKGKLAKILLGEDEQFGGEKGFLDPNLGLGLRRSGRKIVTKRRKGS